MKTFPVVLGPLLLMIVMGLTVSTGAQTAGELKIHPAVEIEFQTETGKAYQLQESTNLSEWSDIDTPTCGTGSPVTLFFTARPGGGQSHRFYRLQVAQTNCPTGLGLLLVGHTNHTAVASNLLGVGGIATRQNTAPNPDDAVLFTVSVRDGPMPQTREQFMAMQGRQRGPAAIFLVEGFLMSDPELRELVLLETRNLLKSVQQPGVDAMPIFYDDEPDILNQVRTWTAQGAPP